MRGLKDKRIIIGGGGTGMGAALATRLVAEGAKVVVGDVNEPALKTSVARLVANGGKALGVAFDLADEASIGRLVQRCVDEFGGVDGLAIPGADLSAATLGNDFDILHMDPKIWTRTFQVNLLGHALLMRASIPHIASAGGGSIVTVSSANAFSGSHTMPAYAATKAGLHALARHVARLCGASKIRCNVVAPGLVMTEGAKVNMSENDVETAVKNNALPRHGEAEDIASALAFLLSDESSWITGQVISVNGGLVFRD
jgi:NAD(P)-dependent dehydrogenase (short-subunit alcohol dehydrogenase family)